MSPANCTEAAHRDLPDRRHRATQRRRHCRRGDRRPDRAVSRRFRRDRHIGDRSRPARCWTSIFAKWRYRAPSSSMRARSSWSPTAASSRAPRRCASRISPKSTSSSPTASLPGDHRALRAVRGEGHRDRRPDRNGGAKTLSRGSRYSFDVRFFACAFRYCSL